MSRPSLVTARAGQRGAATLVVVMILFFIMAMMAAYANRNLVFEQRIASNYYRGGVAAEAADAGAEWTLAMLNADNVDANCASGTGGTSTFRERFLTINTSSRVVTPVGAGVPAAACARKNERGWGWKCSCPDAPPATAPVLDASTQMQPSFQITLTAGTSTTGGVFGINSTGCTDTNPAACGIGGPTIGTAAQNQVGAANISLKAALISALKAPPSAPLTVAQTVSDGGGHLGLHNTDISGSGLLLLSGGNVPSGTLLTDRLDTLPGTPPQLALITGDARLAAVAGNPDTMFGLFFGMPRSTYQTQPAIRSATADQVAGLISSGSRLIWSGSALTLATAGTIGSADKPVVIVVDGSVTISASVTIYGVVYARDDVIADAPQIIVNGAVISGGTLRFTGTAGLMDIYYQAAIINLINNTMGSFVRVPGSWFEGNPS
ncbi:PilX N-terminal domain-containing pilus assembly protein [Pelomonas sp. KK5]|uniref:pilus assembly PilX family protein n=1 Tax=Pelomonas sp. KK5 TaxID=1855730 RepID=UPI00097C1594|nr:PilX N-terminal domain-containing pilus assembly protein [Pelomonas sp. KK5]